MSTAERTVARGGRPLYSLVRAIGAAASDDWSEAGFEYEVHQELKRGLRGSRHYRERAGVLVPPSMFASLSGDTANAGAELVFTSPGGFTGALRPQPVLRQAGARFIFPRDNISLVWMPQGLQVAWQNSEIPSPAITETDPELDHDAPTPSVGMVSLSWTRRLSVQSEPSIDRVIEDDVAAAVATAIDLGAISGSGSNGEPLGLLNNGPVIDGTGGPDYADIVEIEQQVGEAPAPQQGLAWLTSPAGRAALRLAPVEFGGTPTGPIWRDGRILDHPAFATQCVSPAASLIFGPMSNLVIAVHAVELLVDRMTAAARGLIKGAVFVLVSVACAHPGSFVRYTGFTAPTIGS